MVTVTLYKNCIVNNSYSEVFRQDLHFTNYLNGLNKTSFTIDDTYIELNGAINIELASNINLSDYNYISFFQSGTGQYIVRGFIDDYIFSNNVATIFYSCDYWHTFMGKWSLRQSLCTRSRYTMPNEHYELPIEKIINGKGEFTRTNTKVNIILKLQLFNLTAGGQRSGGWIEKEGYFIVGKNIDEGETLTSISSALDNIYQKQDDAYWHIYGGEHNLYANIVECYIVPFEWDIKQYKVNVGVGTVFYDLEYEEVTSNRIYFYKINPHSDLQLNSLDITSDSDIISFGLFNKQIKYEFNGLSQKTYILMSNSDDDLHFYLSYYGKRIEITNEFNFLQDYEVVPAEVLAQREIARKTATVQGITGVINGSLQIAGSVFSAGTSTAVNNASDRLLTFNQNKVARSLIKSYGAEQNFNIGADAVTGIGKIANGVMQIASANAKKYKNFETVNNYTTAIINGIYGLCILKKSPSDVVLNSNEFNYSINETGYIVNYFINTLDVVNNIQDYNIIKFDFVRVVGCSSKINAVIEEILTQGTKIWYTPVIT